MTLVVDPSHALDDVDSDTLFLDQTIQLDKTFEEASEDSGHIFSLAEEMTKNTRERYRPIPPWAWG